MSRITRRRWLKDFCPTLVSIVLVLPLAVALGAFGGWCLGGTAGGWVESFGFPNSTVFGGLFGGLLGAIFGAIHLVHATLNDQNAEDKKLRSPSVNEGDYG